MGFSLKKLFTPPKAIRSLVEGIPGVGTVLKAGQALGGALEKQRPATMVAGFTAPMPISNYPVGPCPAGTYPTTAFNMLGMQYTKCQPLPAGGGMPGSEMMGPMPAGLTPAAIAAYCALSTGGGKFKLAPSPCRGYHWNASRYYVHGDCRTGSQAGVIERGSKLVRNRRINPANAQAARRAVRRLNGTYSLLRSIEKSMVKLGGRSIRAARGASKRRGCSCKGKCTC